MNRKLELSGVTMGCDPEFFFMKKKSVIGAEKVLPQDGVKASYGKVIIDGVQAELNVQSATCRESMAIFIADCFKKLKETMPSGVKVNFSQVIKVDQKELDSLSPESRRFGCAPSFNIYDTMLNKIEVDPSKYLFRSAGGHIHMGGHPALKEADRIVPMLDILVGNTSVLIDRNEWAKERRKVYGRAGEHRLPDFGIEYRTLSNFWLQSYPLMSLMFGLARTAASVIIRSAKGDKNSFESQILKKVNMDDIVKAINENDYDLALKNFKKIEKVLADILPDHANSFPFSAINIPYFYHFITKDNSYWFGDDPLKNWDTYYRNRGYGWENFLATTVKNDMETKTTKTTMKRILNKQWFGDAK